MADKVRMTVWRSPDSPETKLESALHAFGVAEHLDIVLGRETLPFRIRFHWNQRRSRAYLQRRAALGDRLETRGWQRSEVFYNSYLTFDSRQSAERFVELLKDNGAQVIDKSMFTNCTNDGKWFNMLCVASSKRVKERRDYWRGCCGSQIDGWHDNSDARMY